MIKRNYFISAKFHYLDGSGFYIIYRHLTIKSWREDSCKALRECVIGITETAKAKTKRPIDDVAEILAFNRV